MSDIISFWHPKYLKLWRYPLVELLHSCSHWQLQAMDLITVLEATLSPDTNHIHQAEQGLKQAAEADLGVFLSALAAVLADVSKSQAARSAAGLQLKNYLTSKDSEVKRNYQIRWLSFDESVRQHIKNLVLSALGTEVHHFRAAAQCVAYLAAAELPCNTWPELVPVLLNNVTSPQGTEQLKEASLDSIGYMCEDLDPKYLASQSNEILTAIVQGMRKEEPSNNVRLAATKALLNSLEFTKANFEKENERHYLMQVVCEATQYNQEEIQVAALQNLVKIMSLYYVHMEAYMGPALFAITLEAMKSESDKVSLQGIEFWSTVCDEETDLAIEATEAEESGRPPDQTSKFYVKGAMTYLVPLLLETLTKQDEFDDEDDWNPCKAAGVCLSLMASCCEDGIVELIVPFVAENITSADWKRRDAAIMALGSIMEGPDPEELQKYVVQLVPPLIGMMTNDETVQVKDSAAWTLGRVCERCPVAILNEACLLPLLEALVLSLAGETRVAVNTCWAISSLAEAAYDAATNEIEDEEPATFCLSSCYGTIVAKLLETADRADSASNNLRNSAYEALMDMIKYGAKDCYGVVQSTTMTVLEKLGMLLGVLSSAAVGSKRQHISDWCSLVCATLQSLLRRMTRQDTLQISDMVMQYVVLMLQASGSSQEGLQEDAVITMGVLVEVLGEEFIKYMEVVKQLLLVALQNVTEVEVCLAGFGLVGDLCRNLSKLIEPYCRELIEVMISVLAAPSAHRSLKPPILSALGDMALAIGPSFSAFLGTVLGVLEQAAQLEASKEDYDLIDYCNELRDGCLEAYTGIIQGFKDADPKAAVGTSIQTMMELIVRISDDEDKSETNLSNALGLLGDLCTTFGTALAPVAEPMLLKLNKLVTEGKRSRAKRTKTVALWAAKELKLIKQNPDF